MVFIFATTGPYQQDRYLIVALLNCRLLGDVETVQELSDILLLDRGRLLDEGGRLRHSFQGISGDDQLVLLFLAVLALDTFVHLDTSDVLFAQEVTNLNLQ